MNRLDKTIDVEIKRTNSYTYSGDLVFSHTDERGLTATNYWDGLSRLTGRKYPDTTTTSNIYTALDLTVTKDRMGSWSYAGYNGIRQRVAETNANGVVTRYGLSDCSSVISVTNAWSTPEQMVTGFAYDLQGNRTNVYYPDATVTNWYDSLRRVIVTGDASGYRWFVYNNQGLQTCVSNAYGVERLTVFDIDDRPIYVTDANGVTITNTYDDLGRLRTRTYPDTGVEHFGYTARGLVAYTNQLGYTNFYVYDEAGRKRFETNANWELIRYTNNAVGDLIALVDGKNQVTKWKYDEYGRVTNKLDQAGTEILRYKYDPNSRLTNRWSAAKGTTSYSYDALGNLTFVNYPASPDVSFQYDPLNRVTNMIDAVGTNKYAYALGGQLWTEDGPFADDTVTNSYNNRLRVNLDLQQPTGVWPNTFGYDAAKRLTNVTSPAGAFSYQLSATQPSTLIQKLSLPNTSYITNVYDVNARLLSTTLKSSSHSTLNSHQYTYNPGNQRTQQIFPDSSTTDYTYDKIGQLKIADSSVNNDDRGYVYDAAWNLTRRTNAQDAVYVDSSGNWSTHNFYHADGNGNVTYLVDGSQSLAASYRYDPYGNLISSDGSLANDNLYRFSSKMIHVNSGLYYYGYRFYEPNFQRWLSRDPIGESGGLNLYAYVGNNPVNFYDPYGLAIGDWWDARTWFNSGFTESWSDQANSIGKTWGDILAGNWSDIGNNYDDSTLGQAEAAGPGVHKATKICVGTATAAAAAAAALMAAEAAGISDIGSANMGWKGGEITFTRPGAPTPDWRINPFGGSGYPPHYHRRPGIGKHRPWDGGF